MVIEFVNYEIFDETGSIYNLSKARAIHYPRFFLICNAHVSTLISKKTRRQNQLNFENPLLPNNCAF